MLPCGVNLFVDPIYGSEDIAMPKVVSEHVKRQQGHRNIYVLDRGLQSTRNMAAFSKESICFIARSKENRKYVELEQIPFTDSDLGGLELIRDSKVYLYTGQPVMDKRGNKFIKQELNASHLISLNKNGIEVIFYMTLITAMLVLIYKRANNVGYKTAKRRFAMEIRDLAIAMISVQCGGTPALFFKT